MLEIRNFSIIAHIDHGKSTLADRLLEYTKVITPRERKDQILDNMDIERERGITIKNQTVALPYKDKNGKEYTLNLIDTPGHVDFTYEVSRALASCEGALLLIDAVQGVQAQTLANLYLALENDLDIIPVINKIDLPTVNIDNVKHQIDKELGLDPESVILISAKEGTGVTELLEKIVSRIPPPGGRQENPLQALIFDSIYDPYKGAVIYCRIFEGIVKKGDLISFYSNKNIHLVEEVGRLKLKREIRPALEAGEVGYITAGIKNIKETRIGDTITLENNKCRAPLPGFKPVKPVVFSSIYPVNSEDYEHLAEALEKLKLNDSSFTYEKDTSVALGFGFRCGFLGLLHLEVIQERLEREFALSLILTAPSVQYKITLKNGTEIIVDNPAKYPEQVYIDYCEEPYIKATILVPEQYLGGIISLCINCRGVQKGLNYKDKNRVELLFELPLAEVIYDFYDRLKSLSRGYASYDYELDNYRKSNLVKLDILVNGEVVDALSMILHKDRAIQKGRTICKKLKNEIPRQLFKVPIQGAIGGQIVSRETISTLRKDVTAKCYGGDITRKRKLLEKQKEGKKRMKMVGSVEIPQSAFLAVLKTHEEN
ncbi:MAG: translation elongation factor 4 [Thermodesulfobacteriota bacterium]|nr:translation elongation factor 4 [Thermodesulfobacteriota bacterium]